MTRFHGNVGYASENVEVRPGYWKEQVKEIPYFGDVTSVSRKYQGEQRVNGAIRVQNRISIVADAYAFAHIFEIRYVWWQGVRWQVSDVEVKPPRLILRIGDIYNGSTTGTTTGSE